MPDHHDTYHKNNLVDKPDMFPHKGSANDPWAQRIGINGERELSKGMKKKKGSNRTTSEVKKMVSYDEIRNIEAASEGAADDVARKETENVQKQNIDELSEEERKTMTDAALNMFFFPDEEL